MGTRHESLRLADEAEERPRRRRSDGLAYALNNQAQYHKETGDNPRANTLFTHVYAISKALADERCACVASSAWAAPPRWSPQSGPWATTSRPSRWPKRWTNTRALGICYCNLADWKVFTGEYDAALDLYMRSADYAAAAGRQGRRGPHPDRPGASIRLRHDYDAAWAFLNTALPLLLSTADIEGELRAYLNIAHLYVVQGDISRACDYYQRTLDKSILAPNSSCMIFAQQALDQVANGPCQPGIDAMEPITGQDPAAQRSA